MQTNFLKNKVGFLTISALVFATTSFAQATTAPAASVAAPATDFMPIILMSVAGLLAFVIWGLSRVVLMLARQTLDKSKAPKIIPGVLVAILLLFVQVASAQDAGTAGAVKEVVAKGPGLPTLYYILFFVLGVEIVIITFLTIMIKQFSYELLPEAKKKLASESKLKIWWSNLGKKMTNAVPLEHEADVVMDHEYDGIRELDNALPPWWKYGFYITIVFSVCYFFYFSVFGYGKNPTEEYNAEMAKAKIEIEKYESNNKDKIDEKNVPMADAAGLATAKAIFEVKCFACHGKMGEGGAGPNLTDNYWLHSGSLNDIYLSIKHGYPDKGMQAWSSVYNPKEISELASYIVTLKGTNPPNGKAPQGDLYAAPGATSGDNATPATSDSATGSPTSGKE